MYSMPSAMGERVNRTAASANLDALSGHLEFGLKDNGS